MKSLLKKLFIDNWQRKLLALILAIITWLFVNHSLTITKTINDVPIRVINLAKDKTIKGMQSDGILFNTFSLEIQGNKTLIEPITNETLEILVDLKNNKNEEYVTFITKNDLISKNPNINIDRAIKKLKTEKLTINLSKFVTEKIPLLITQPIGEAPKGYQFLDIWPYRFYITVSGPEEIIKGLKAEGLKLTFNLNVISEKELDAIDALKKRGKRDVISFFVPTIWKRVHIPDISSSFMEVDDPNAKSLRIDFIKKEFIPIPSPLPVYLFFPANTSDKLNPNNITLANNDFVKKINGIDMITTPLFAKGVSELFVDCLKERMHIVILVEPDQDRLSWNIQSILPLNLEKFFIKKIITEETEEESRELHPYITDDYLRLRFRVYLNKFRIWTSPQKKLNLKITLKNDKVTVIPD